MVAAFWTGRDSLGKVFYSGKMRTEREGLAGVCVSIYVCVFCVSVCAWVSDMSSLNKLPEVQSLLSQ